MELKNISIKALFFLICLTNYSLSKEVIKEGKLFIVIYLGDNFKNDKVDLIIDNNLILDDVILYSNVVYGLTPYWIKIYKNKGNCYFVISEKGKRKKMEDIKNLELHLIINEKDNKFIIDPDQGKFIVINKYDDFKADFIQHKVALSFN